MEILIDPSNIDLIHHVVIYECDPSVVFDDNNLPEGLRDTLPRETGLCSVNTANAWAVGGDYVSTQDFLLKNNEKHLFNQLMEFPEEAGYPMGGNHDIKYYMIEIHYNNPTLSSGKITR